MSRPREPLPQALPAVRLMCNRPRLHEAENDVRQLGGDLTLTQKCLLHAAIVRDWHPTLGEILAALTAEREAQREAQEEPLPR